MFHQKTNDATCPWRFRILGYLDAIQKQSIMTRRNLLHPYTVISSWMKVLSGGEKKKKKHIKCHYPFVELSDVEVKCSN